MGLIKEDNNKGVEQADGLIDSIMLFGKVGQKTAVELDKTISGDFDLSKLGDLKNLNYKELKDAGEGLIGQLKDFNPKVVVQALSQMFVGGAVNELLARVVAIPIRAGTLSRLP